MIIKEDMKMEDKNTNDLFISIKDSINFMLKSDIYNEKDIILKIKTLVEDWYNNYIKSNSLALIKSENLKFLDLEITSLFDKYIKKEPVKKNYCERLYYSFSILEKNGNLKY